MGITINNGYNYNRPNNIITMLNDLVSFNSTSGSAFGVNVESIARQNEHSNTRIFLTICKEDENNPNSFEVTKQLEIIKKNFQLKDQELAKVIKVSRSTINTWRRTGRIPRDASSNRVFELFMLSKNWEDQGFVINRRQLRTRIIKKISVFDMLISEAIDAQQILFAGNSLSVLSENNAKVELF